MIDYYEIIPIDCGNKKCDVGCEICENANCQLVVGVNDTALHMCRECLITLKSAIWKVMWEGFDITLHIRRGNGKALYNIRDETIKYLQENRRNLCMELN